MIHLLLPSNIIEEVQGGPRFTAVEVPEGPLFTAVNVPVEPHLAPKMHAPVEETDEVMERRRKGKGVCMEWAPVILKDHSPRPGPVVSGSGSCDPTTNEGGLVNQHVEESSEDADSKAGPMGCPLKGLGTIKGRPILVSDGSLQDEDMGGEGDMTKKKGNVQVTMMEEGKSKSKLVENEGKAVGQEKRGSRGSTGSVPPGFSRLARSGQGAASPFGKFQRGGLKFLKRSATSSGSIGANTRASAPSSKKNRPIAGMSSKEIAEVASNVGVAERMTEEQIRRLKQQEKDQASS